jgi:hypothetical protein
MFDRKVPDDSEVCLWFHAFRRIADRRLAGAEGAYLFLVVFFFFDVFFFITMSPPFMSLNV